MLKGILLFFSLLNVLIDRVLIGSEIPINITISECIELGIVSIIPILVILIGKKPLKKGLLIICLIFNIFVARLMFDSFKYISILPNISIILNIVMLINYSIYTILVCYKIYKNYKYRKYDAG
ncbi:MAG: hypothetical protein ACRCW0_05940 [Clostridium sp.]